MIVFPSIIVRINCSRFMIVLSTIAFSRASSASLSYTVILLFLVLFGFLFSVAGVSGFLLTSESVRTDSVLVETAALYSFHFIEIHFLS